jgi:hypothetical protein
MKMQRLIFTVLGAVMTALLGCSTGNNAAAGGTGGKGGETGGASGGSNGGARDGSSSGGTGGSGASATGGASTGPAGGTCGGSTGCTASTGGNTVASGRAKGTGATSATGGVNGGAGGGFGGVATGGSAGSAAGGADGGTSGKATGGAAGGAAGAGGGGGSSGRDAAVDFAVDANRGDDVATDARVGDAASMPGTNNPVLAGYNADPNVVLFDNTFYIFPTTDGFANWGATSFSVFSSTNLVQWTNRGVILDLAKDLTWAQGHGWAPGIVRVAGTYFFYFSADSQIGVATSSAPTGPFKDALGKPLVTKGQYGPQSIDPYPFIDDDGTPYLYFGSAAGGLRVVKMNPDMISFAGTPTNISPSGASGTLEGSAMFKRKGSYYLAWSEGDTRNATYLMAYAHAQSPLGCLVISNGFFCVG